MRTIEKTVYTFDELTDRVKEKVIKDQIEFESEVYTCDWLIQEWVEKLKEEGFINAKIHYSGFYSQGDGACFDAEIDLKKFVNDYKTYLPLLAKRLDRIDEYIEAGICKNSYSNWYSHEKTRYIDVTCNSDLDERQVRRLAKEVKILDELIEKDRLDLCKQFYKELKEDYERVTSSESAIADIKANEYEYFEDGEMYNG